MYDEGQRASGVGFEVQTDRSTQTGRMTDGEMLVHAPPKAAQARQTACGWLVIGERKWAVSAGAERAGCERMAGKRTDDDPHKRRGGAACQTSQTERDGLWS